MYMFSEEIEFNFIQYKKNANGEKKKVNGVVAWVLHFCVISYLGWYCICTFLLFLFFPSSYISHFIVLFWFFFCDTSTISYCFCWLVFCHYKSSLLSLLNVCIKAFVFFIELDPLIQILLLFFFFGFYIKNLLHALLSLYKFLLFK